MTYLYENAYSFLLPFAQPTDQKLLTQPDYLIDHYDEIKLTLETTILDYLPQPMPDFAIYSYEFDQDANSAQLKWRQNHTTYLEQYRRFIFTLLGYFPHFYLDSTEFSGDDFEEPHLYQYERTLASVERVDDMLISALKNFYHVLLVFPDEKVLISVNDLRLDIKTNNLLFLEFAKKIACTNGLYLQTMK
ncbi:hypothetical protein [Vagococcus sp.]|uniref:hypothetical protein n=1 Tax=Vagococcus sp. TaxID=1933889 RepID=UPI003F96B806